MIAKALRVVRALIAAGAAMPMIRQTFPLAEAEPAHAVMAADPHTGKPVLVAVGDWVQAPWAPQPFDRSAAPLYKPV